MGTTLQGIKLYSYLLKFSFSFSSFFSYKMKICYFFVIVAGVIALGAVTAAREIEIVKRDIAASEDESKLLAEDPNGEAGKASLLAQLTRREADDTTRRPPFHWPPRDYRQGAVYWAIQTAVHTAVHRSVHTDIHTAVHRYVQCSLVPWC